MRPEEKSNLVPEITFLKRHDKERKPDNVKSVEKNLLIPHDDDQGGEVILLNQFLEVAY
jgi:hypothetical protein